jgi:hypothetical protein
MLRWLWRLLLKKAEELHRSHIQSIRNAALAGTPSVHWNNCVGWSFRWRRIIITATFRELGHCHHCHRMDCIHLWLSFRGHVTGWVFWIDGHQVCGDGHAYLPRTKSTTRCPFGPPPANRISVSTHITRNDTASCGEWCCWRSSVKSGSEMSCPKSGTK